MNAAIRTALLAAVTVLLGNTFTAAKADDDIYKDDGVVYLVSTEPGVAEEFQVFKDGNDLEIVHYVYVNGQLEEINDKDYDYSDVDLIRFIGDDDADELVVDNGHSVYVNGQLEEINENAVNIPVLAHGFGGDDRLYGGLARCVFYGGSGEDVLVGSPVNDYLDPGNDYQVTAAAVFGLGGADTFVNWQRYVQNPRTGAWELEDYQHNSFFCDFDSSEGDVWKSLIRSNFSNLPIQNPPPTKTTNDSKYQIR